MVGLALKSNNKNKKTSIFINKGEMLMNMLLLSGIIIAIVFVYSIMNYVGKAKHPVKKSITGVLTGFAALAVVNLISPLTSVTVPISVVTIIVAAAGGLPGVTLILALNAFF